MPDVKYVAVVDNSGAIIPIQELDKAWNALHQKGKETPEVMGEAAKAFQNVFAQFTAGALAARGIETFFGAAKRFATEAVQGALAEEESAHRLTTALEMTGRARGGGIKDMLDFAQSQAKVTTYTHEEIEATETLLAQLTHLDNEGIKRMTMGVMGLASVLGPGEGLQGATSRVTRAIEGSAEGLRRVGIVIDTTLPKQEQLAEIQKRLVALYPRATAELETLGGEIKQAGKAWEELKEQVGEAWLAMSHAPVVVRATVDAINWLRENIGGGSGLAEGIARGKSEAKEFQLSLKELHPTMKELGDVMAGGRDEWEAYIKHARELDAWMVVVEPNVEKVVNAVAKFFKVAAPAPVFDLAQAFKDLGIKSGPELTGSLKLAEQTMDAYLATAHPAPGIVEDLGKKISDLKTQLAGANFELDRMGHLVPKGSLDLAPAFRNIEPAIAPVNVALEKTHTILASIIGGPLGEVIDGMYEYRGATADGDIQTEKLKNVWQAMTRLEIRGEIKMLTAEMDRMTASGHYTAEELAKIKAAIEALKKSLSTPTWMTAWADKLNDAVAAMTPVVQGFDAVFAQAQKNKEIAIENEYKKRLAVINATIKDEDKKQKAIIALEAEFQIKRTEAARAGAKGAKAVALMEAVVNTASGVARAFKDYMFPLSAIIAGIVGTLGAIQIGLIAAQPIPLARGAVFTKPTRIVGADGTEYVGGEAGTEILAPEPKLRTIVREETRFMGGGFTFNGPLVQINTTGLSDADIREAGDRLYVEVNRQLRRIGRA